MDHIERHWTAQAERGVVWDDTYCVQLEQEQLRRHVPQGAYVLDCGAGLGENIAHLIETRRVTPVGIDYCTAMVKGARRAGLPVMYADVRKLPFADEQFDVVYSVRCLINLPTWDDQKRAIDEMLRVTKRKLVLCEAFWEPLQLLNAMRAMLQLSPLVEHDFNRYLKMERLHAMGFRI